MQPASTKALRLVKAPCRFYEGCRCLCWPAKALRLTPLRTAQVASRDVPVDWRIELPSQGLDITTSALNDESWQVTLFPYWEGPVTASGTHEGQGYLEMTGY